MIWRVLKRGPVPQFAYFDCGSCAATYFQQDRENRQPPEDFEPWGAVPIRKCLHGAQEAH